MFKNGKLFGKVSIIDLLVLLVIIVSVIGVYLRFTSTTEVVKVESEKFSYEVCIEGVREYTIEGLKQLGKVYDKETKEDLGEITEVVSVEKVTNTEINSRGEVIESESPDKYVVVIKIETDGNVGDNGYYTSTNRSIGVGGELSVESKYVSTMGRITKIEK